MDTMKNKENIIASWIDSHRAELIEAADYLHAHPELAYKEYISSRYLAGFLEKHGFVVSYNTADIETAFTAVWRNNGATEDVKPVLGFLAEYDALAEIGHACGHNLLGTGVCAAACAMKADMEATGAPGTIYVYGCPAEEIMSGKIIMNQHHVFDHLDVGIM
ncbi:MAG: amidohydrolase, partial [Dorea sp.]